MTPGSSVAPEDLAGLRRLLKGLRSEVNELAADAADVQSRTDRLLELEREQVFEQASIAAIPAPRLLSSSILLEGSASQRLRVRRTRVGKPVERPFSRDIGVTRCETDAADVRELWERLLAFEAQCGDDVLRGHRSTILDIPNASVSVAEGRMVRIAMGQADAGGPVVAVPRCAYDCAPQKLRNFGHWLLDCVPQIVALWQAAPDALFLLPPAAKGFHQSTLTLLGISPDRLMPWDGTPLRGSRVLAFESDGRTGGGRPLSSLMEVRNLMAPPAGWSSVKRTRRIYVSRRDAVPKRRWVVNEDEVEALFRSRGFEVVVMAECTLEAQVRLFREACVVAGVSGASFADLVFSAPGIHAVVLISDSLVRWYADEAGARSSWAGGRRVAGGQLAALGDSPRYQAYVAAALEQRCHMFVAGDQMPVPPLRAFLDEVLAEVDRA